MGEGGVVGKIVGGVERVVGEVLGVDDVLLHVAKLGTEIACVACDVSQLGDEAIEGLADVRGIGTDEGETEPCEVQCVLMRDFGNCDHVLAVQAVLQTEHHAAFVFERLTAADEDVELEDAEEHGERRHGGTEARRHEVGGGTEGGSR